MRQHADANTYRTDFLFYMKRLPFDKKISSSSGGTRLPFSTDQSYTPIAPTTYTTALPILASRLRRTVFLASSVSHVPSIRTPIPRQLIVDERYAGITFLKL